jgi:hypothetical protein
VGFVLSVPRVPRALRNSLKTSDGLEPSTRALPFGRQARHVRVRRAGRVPVGTWAGLEECSRAALPGVSPKLRPLQTGLPPRGVVGFYAYLTVPSPVTAPHWAVGLVLGLRLHFPFCAPVV